MIQGSNILSSRTPLKQLHTCNSTAIPTATAPSTQKKVSRKGVVGETRRSTSERKTGIATSTTSTTPVRRRKQVSETQTPGRAHRAPAIGITTPTPAKQTPARRARRAGTVQTPQSQDAATRLSRSVSSSHATIPAASSPMGRSKSPRLRTTELKHCCDNIRRSTKCWQTL